MMEDGLTAGCSAAVGEAADECGDGYDSGTVKQDSRAHGRPEAAG